MRLIDAHEYAKELKNEMDWPGRHPEFISAIECAMADLSDMPTIEARPVVHARWIFVNDRCACSECRKCLSYDGNDVILDMSNLPYCPHCGATMDLESEGTDE